MDGYVLLFGPATSSGEASVVGTSWQPDELWLTGNVAAPGDVDGDGFGDLAYNYQTSATGDWLSKVDLGPITSDADWGTGAVIRDALAIDVAGDSDGDGYSDLWEANEDHFVLWRGGPVLKGDMDLDKSSFAAEVVGGFPDSVFQGLTSGVGDLDLDGFPDLVVASAYGDLPSPEGGTAFVLLGPFAGAVDISDHSVFSVRGDDGDLLGYGVAGGHDLDGDGTMDLALGAPSRLAPHDPGEVYMFLGRTWR